MKDRIREIAGELVQLYAARSRDSWGIGDLGDLRSIRGMAADQGAGFVLINPLHAVAPIAQQEASPYLPATRRFLNPIYLRVPEVPGADAVDLEEDAGQALGDGELIEGYVADNEHDEAAWVAEQIDALVDEGAAQPKDIAVFYRTNNASRVFEEVFIRVGMPYKVVGGVRFYERKEVRDALAYLKVVANPTDIVSLRRVINTPKRGIGERAEACIENFADRERIAFANALRRCSEIGELATRSLKAIQEFVALLEEFEQLVETGSGPAALLESILDRTGYLAELPAAAGEKLLREAPKGASGRSTWPCWPPWSPRRARGREPVPAPRSTRR